MVFVCRVLFAFCLQFIMHALTSDVSHLDSEHCCDTPPVLLSTTLLLLIQASIRGRQIGRCGKMQHAIKKKKHSRSPPCLCKSLPKKSITSWSAGTSRSSTRARPSSCPRGRWRSTSGCTRRGGSRRWTRRWASFLARPIFWRGPPDRDPAA